MEKYSNENCILIKTKDLEELKKKAESKKLDRIRISTEFFFLGRGLDRIEVSSDLNLHLSLRQQIGSIYGMAERKLNEKKKEIQEGTLRSVANMSKKKRNKLLKQYKD